MNPIEIEINGQKFTGQPNQTVIQVADDAGIYIPRFCYHKNLSIPANCRMCLVEVEKAPKPLPACATPLAPGMKIFTKSQRTIAAQRAVMEFLLLNHPLDCPICDQGGECELQDLSMGYGSSWSHYKETKRSVPDQNLGPLIETEMTRCIHCTRCVRFGDEVAGLSELGLIGRGEFTEISTYIQHAMRSEISGNIIDLCPVGALTSKPFRFRARAWELDQAKSISPHDCLGSNINVHTRFGTVMRVVSEENKAINDTWIADRDRFSYTGLYHEDRIQTPRIRVNGKWREAAWEEALSFAADGLKRIVQAHGVKQLSALASPSSTVEEFYLLQKLMRGLGSSNIDHRLREVDFSDQDARPLAPITDLTLSELSDATSILLIGSNLQKEQPMAAIQVRKAAIKQATIMAINPVDYRFSFDVTVKQIIAPHVFPQFLHDLTQEQDVAKPDETLALILDQLKNKRSVIVLGALVQHHPQSSLLRYYVDQLARLTGAKVMQMTDGANATGGWLAGAVPHRGPSGSPCSEKGLSAYELFKSPRKSYLFMNVEPTLDCSNANDAYAAIQQADFVVALSIYRHELFDQHAHVILPLCPFTETDGTFVNVLGHWQHFSPVAKSYGEAKPGWKILKVLGNLLELSGFNYQNGGEIREQLKQQLTENKFKGSEPFQPDQLQNEATRLSRIGEIPHYSIDSLVRRAQPLQQAQVASEGDIAAVRMHPLTAEKLNIEHLDTIAVKQTAATISAPLILDDRIALDAVWLAGGISGRLTDNLFGEIMIE